MENKYQKAKDNIKKYCKCVVGPEEYTFLEMENDLDALQELIDNYDELLKLCVNETKEKVIFSNALDKTCQILAMNEIMIPSTKIMKFDYHTIPMTSACWRENIINFILKESEEETNEQRNN